jgi:lipopolysaccharide transport system permease protein
VPWLFFANGLLQGGNALVTNAQLVTKVYFPRILIPFATLLAGAVDFAIGLVVLIAAMLVAGIAPGPQALLAIPLLGLGFLVALGLAVGLSALNVRYRDVRHAVPFLVQLWFFATPVVYPITILGEPWRTIAALNPMTGVVEGFRWALLGAGDPGGLLGISIASGLAMTVAGLAYFARVERTFADVV